MFDVEDEAWIYAKRLEVVNGLLEAMGMAMGMARKGIEIQNVYHVARNTIRILNPTGYTIQIFDK
jgi:hypothetical protein